MTATSGKNAGNPGFRIRTVRRLSIILFVFACRFLSDDRCVAAPGEADAARPPGVIVDTSPDFDSVYVGSPSIAVLPDGTYVASHDWFGPTSHHAMTTILASRDRGRSWTKLTEFQFYHGNLFVHRDALYILGEFESKRGETPSYSHYAIRRSRDGGKTWSEPRDATSGLLRTDGTYHTAPCPVVVHAGRLWRAIEDVMPAAEAGKHQRNTVEFGGRFRAIMTSVPLEADLLDARNWVFSTPFVFEMNHWTGYGFLEGNAVVSPENTVVNVLRCSAEGREKAIILDCDADGKRLRSRGADSQIDFPGGAVKFTIRFDPVGRKYWTISNKQADPLATRNVSVLMSSDNLRDWEVRTILFRHLDRRYHAWQYVDWQFDGNDIIAVSRTGWDGSHNHHDANYMTFHRITDFRGKTRDEDAAWLGDLVRARKETASLSIEALLNEGQSIRFGVLENGKPALANRNYVWKNVPEQYRGWKTLMNYGGDYTQFRITAKKKLDVLMVRPVTNRTGRFFEWAALSGIELCHTKAGEPTRMAAYRRILQQGETIELPLSPCFSGETLVFAEK